MTNDFQMHMDEYLPLRDVVFNTLREAILTGQLKPGERLMEISLANRLGVSRTPIREAIRKLELEGLVIMIPRKGAKVASITGLSVVFSSCLTIESDWTHSTIVCKRNSSCAWIKETSRASVLSLTVCSSRTDISFRTIDNII